MARIDSHNDDIIRNPEGYEDMLKKLREREEEAVCRVKERSGSEEPLKAAKHKLQQLQHRRDIKPLSPTEKGTKVDPSDPGVLEVRDAVQALSNRIDTAIKQNPDANRAVLAGRVKLGKPDTSSGGAQPKTDS